MRYPWGNIREWQCIQFGLTQLAASGKQIGKLSPNEKDLRKEESVKR